METFQTIGAVLGCLFWGGIAIGTIWGTIAQNKDLAKQNKRNTQFKKED